MPPAGASVPRGSTLVVPPGVTLILTGCVFVVYQCVPYYLEVGGVVDNYGIISGPVVVENGAVVNNRCGGIIVPASKEPWGANPNIAPDGTVNTLGCSSDAPQFPLGITIAIMASAPSLLYVRGRRLRPDGSRL
ncbi:MAG TPA: hypothetical protein VEJ36_00590 [Nitrososphaerales archaeon]|nr:hypothetical protein [Nitrososphaerales archaeon]